MTDSQVKDQGLKDLFYTEQPAYFGCRFSDISRASTAAFFPMNIFIMGLSVSFDAKHKLYRAMSTLTRSFIDGCLSL